MLIRDLEIKTGLDRATIRFYEKEGLITPVRQDNGYRTYAEIDCEKLLKIKLLRQLGMSLYKIKSLQQGSEDFGEALDAQIQSLGDQIRESSKAREVCVIMRDAGVTYESLDASYYLDLLKEMPARDPESPSNDFKEQVPSEIHPIRRFAARMLDYYLLSALIYFLLFVIARIRPLPGDFWSALLNIGIWILLVPLETLMLHFWGTTPGKWIMGIRLEYFEGGRLSLSAALDREWRVFRHGIGFGIPLWQFYCMVRSYCRLTGRSLRRFARYDEVDWPEEMAWDDQTELIYTNCSGKGKWFFAAVCVILALNAVTFFDSLKPTYRGSDLTIAQFAENYNDICAMLSRDNAASYTKMKPDGTWQEYQDAGNIVYTDGTPEEKDPLTYITENGCIREIHYANTWTDVWYAEPLMGSRYTIAWVLLQSQEETGLQDMREFEKLYNEQVRRGDSSGSFRYGNLEISWSIDTKNCESVSGSYWAADENSKSSLALSYRIILHKD